MEEGAIADRLDHLDKCIDGVRDAQLDYHQLQETRHDENSARLARIEAGLGEVRDMARAAFTWTSTEEKQREKEALIEAGRQLEREHWQELLARLEGICHEIWDWVGKPAIGAGALLVAHNLGVIHF